MQLRQTITMSLLASAVMLHAAALADDPAPKMQTFKGAQGMELDSMGLEGINAFLNDMVSSDDPDAPITCGLFRMEKGGSLEYTYSYDEAKFIVAGEMTLAEEGGETFQASAGDVVYFGKGATITFSSESSGLAFYCGQRREGEL